MVDKQKNLFTALEAVSKSNMYGNIESIAFTYHTKDGNVISYYDNINDDADIFSLIGALDVLKARVTLGMVDMPEISDDDEGEE